MLTNKYIEEKICNLLQSIEIIIYSIILYEHFVPMCVWYLCNNHSLRKAKKQRWLPTPADILAGI